MWLCRKCKKQVAESGKICRACGGILEEVPETPPQEDLAADVPLAEGASTLDVENAGPDWRCSRCGEIVPGNFDECWKCMTNKAGEQHPDVRQLVSEVSETDQDAQSSEAQDEAINSKTGCSRCGSTKIIRNATIVDQGDSSDGKLKAMVLGNPDALIFKDRLYGEIQADICGKCGHIDFRVANPSQLYEQEQKAKQRASRSEPMELSSKPCLKCGMLVVKRSPTCPHCGTGNYSD